MKKEILMAAVVLSAVTAAAAPLDKGGVTFDLKKCSAELFKPAKEVPQSENLITNADGKLAEKASDHLRWRGSSASFTLTPFRTRIPGGLRCANLSNGASKMACLPW